MQTLKCVKAGETEMRYAPAGYKFSVPVDDILNAQGRLDNRDVCLPRRHFSQDVDVMLRSISYDGFSFVLD